MVVATVMVDVFAVDGKRNRIWISRFTHHAPDESGDDVLAASGVEVERFVQDTLAEAHAGEAGYDATKLAFEVFLVRGTASTSALVDLTADPVALLVDPEADIMESLLDRAARVRVTTMPTVPDELRWSLEDQ